MEEILRMDRRQFASRSAASVAALFLGALGVDSLVERAGAAVDAGPPSTPKGKFTVAQDAPPSTFDPAKAALGTEFRIARNTCEPLVYYDKNYKIQPLLASSWQSSSDNRKWSFTVRKGVRFHDGLPWTSTAMRKNFEYYAANAGGLQALLLPKFVSLDDSDPSVLHVVFGDPAPDLLRSATILYMVSPATLAKGPTAVAAGPVGTGPFVLGQSTQQGVQIVAAPSYWGKGPYFQSIFMETVSEEAAKISGFLAGDLDMILGQPPLALQQFRNNKKYKVLTVSSIRTAGFALPVVTPPCTDVRVRQAIMYGVNSPAIVNAKFAKGGVTPALSLVAPQVKGYDPPKTPYAYDPAKARKLLKQAGHGSGLKVTLLSAISGFEAELVSQTLVSQLKEVGITLNAQVQDVATWVKNVYGTNPPPMAYASYGDVTGYPLFMQAGYLGINAHYTGQDLKKLVNKANHSANGPGHQQALTDLQEFFSPGQKALWYPILHEPVNAVVHSNLQGFYVPPDQATEYFGEMYYS
jgi:ABC-type transport system substrate-binding protein